MKKLFIAMLTLCVFATSCDKDESTSQVEAKSVISSCINIDFTNNCTGPSLFNNSPFFNEQTSYQVEGWYYGTVNCISPTLNCFGVGLRMAILREFGKHTNNPLCGTPERGEIPCPTSGYTQIECYDNNDGNFLDLEDITGINLNDGIQVQEANLIYQEFMCRILNDVDTSAGEFIKINNMKFDSCLCGDNDLGFVYTMEVYRVN